MTDDKRPRWLLAAVAVLVLLVGVALLGLLPARHDGRTGTATAAPSPAAAPPTATSSAPAEALRPLTAAPSGVTWELFQKAALPTSRTDGPTRVSGPVHAGFSHTPTGALLADVQISYRTTADPDLDDLRRVVDAQLAEGPGKTAYLELLSQLEENDPPANGYAQVVGFRYLAYAPDLAVISLATRGSSGRIQVGPDTMRWVDGDWELEKPATGPEQPQVVADLTGYVPWSGVS